MPPRIISAAKKSLLSSLKRDSHALDDDSTSDTDGKDINNNLSDTGIVTDSGSNNDDDDGIRNRSHRDNIRNHQNDEESNISENDQEEEGAAVKKSVPLNQMKISELIR